MSVIRCAAFVVVLFILSLAGLPQSVPSLRTLPGTLAWQNPPRSWHLDGGTLTISAGAKTDWFVDPFDGSVDNNAPILLFTPDPDYVLTARVALKFETKWDAGALVLPQLEMERAFVR